MGTANKQISTYSNIANKRIHNGFSASYATTATKCVTKDNIEMIEYLVAKNRSTTSNIYYASNGYYGLGLGETPIQLSLANIVNNNIEIQHIVPTNMYYTTSTYDYTSSVYCSAMLSDDIIAHNAVTIGLNGSWPNYTDVDTLRNHAIFTKQITGIASGNVQLEYTLSIEGILGVGPTSQSSDGWATAYGISNPTITHGVIITDGNGQLITLEIPSTVSNTSLTNSITFTASTNTINVYIIIPSLSFDFYTDFSGPDARYGGFKLATTTNLTYYESYYDVNTKCVQYQDVEHPTGKTFTVYYGVWNNKSSSAKLNNVYVQIKKSTESSWITIGTTPLGTISSSRTGTITCILPTSFDPTVEYDLRVVCGETGANQQWYYRWGSQSSLTTSGYSWTHYGKVTTGVCPNEYGLNTHSMYSTLRNYNYSTSTLSRGRSATSAALFCIE